MPSPYSHPSTTVAYTPAERAKILMDTKGQTRHTVKYAAETCKVSTSDIYKLIPSAKLFSWDKQAKQYFILASDMQALKEKLAERAPGPVISLKPESAPAAAVSTGLLTRNDICRMLKAEGFNADIQILSKLDKEGKWPAAFKPVGKRPVGINKFPTFVYKPEVIDALRPIFIQRKANAWGGHKKINKQTNPIKPTTKKLSAKIMQTADTTAPLPDMSAMFERLINQPQPSFGTQSSATIVTHNKAAYVSLNDLAADLIVSGFDKAGVYLLTKYNPKV